MKWSCIGRDFIPYNLLPLFQRCEKLGKFPGRELASSTTYNSYADYSLADILYISKAIITYNTSVSLNSERFGGKCLLWMVRQIIRSISHKHTDFKYQCIDQRVHAQTTYIQENLAFCFQLCTVAHFVGLLLLPWFSSSLVFFPYSWFGGFFVSYLVILLTYDNIHIVLSCPRWLGPSPLWPIYCLIPPTSLRLHPGALAE